MGLTIHYKLKTNLTKVDDIHRLVEGLRQYAMDLPFQSVEDVVEFQGDEVSYDDQDDPNRWLKIQAGKYLHADQYSYSVAPKHIIAFTTVPGEGSEPANFGFCLYPNKFTIPKSNRRIRTNLNGWLWGSFCKTQYASDPAAGGVANFLRCHLCVVKLLDFAKKTNLMDVEVSDEGDYWEERDLEKLGKNVGEWNQMIAAFAGQLNDALQGKGITLESAISGFANYEHLEAKGLEKFKELRLFGNR